MSNLAAEKLPSEKENVPEIQSPENRSGREVFGENTTSVEVRQEVNEMESLRAKELATDKDRRGFVRFLKELPDGKLGKWMKVAMGVFILGGAATAQHQTAKEVDSLKPASVESLQLDDPAQATGENELLREKSVLNESAIEADLYGMFQTEEMMEAGIAGKLVSKIMTSVKERTQLGETLISIDGIMWTWQAVDGTETTSVIDSLKKNKKHLNDESAQDLEEHEEQQAKARQAEKRNKQEQRIIDLAGEKISNLYQEILEKNNYENVLPLDNESIDKYLKSGYCLIVPLYDGVGKNMLGFVMNKISVNDKVVFELVVDDLVAEELDSMIIAPAPTKMLTRADVERVPNLIENYFPAESMEVTNSIMELMDKIRVTSEEYDEYSSRLAVTRNTIVQGSPELEELNQKIDDSMAGLSDMFKTGASIEERRAYVDSLDLDKQLDELKQHVVRGTSGEAALHLLDQTISVEFQTASLWDKVSD